MANEILTLYTTPLGECILKDLMKNKIAKLKNPNDLLTPKMIIRRNEEIALLQDLIKQIEETENENS